MDGFAGLVLLNTDQVSQEIEDRIVNTMFARRAAHVAISRSRRALFVQETQSRTTVRLGPSPIDNDHALYAASARLDNREELASAIGVERSTLAQMPDAMLIRRVFAAEGDAGLAKIVGTFAFASWDEQSQRLTMARDCLGGTPLFYCAQRNFVAFATTLNALLGLPFVPREIDEVMLGHFIALNLRESVRTLYRGIERVPSRTRVTADSTGIRRHRYWEPNLQARPPCSSEHEYIETARELLDRSVLAALRDTPLAALLLSGGLDSSAIAATCARLGLADRITCYTGVPAGEAKHDAGAGRYFSERDKVELLSGRYPDLNIKYVTPPIVHPWDEDPARYFARYGMPVRNVGNLGWFSGLEDAFDPAISTVMLGTRGNFGLTWNGMFSLVDLLQAGRWQEFAHELFATAKENGQNIVQTLHHEVAVRRMPDRVYRSYRRLRGHNPDAAPRYSSLNPEFVADNNLTVDWKKQGFDPQFTARQKSGAQFRAYHLFDHNQIARDAQALHYQTSGRQARHPLGYRPLLEFCLAVPEPMFRQNGMPRSFARRVLADRLPPEILNERRRGTQAPTWFRALDARREDIVSNIDRFEASPLARRLLDLPRMKRLVAEWPKDESVAESRKKEYRYALARSVHVGQFIRWVEGGNA
jgi:asparagine synthase (glutamine-hydrolysing)